MVLWWIDTVEIWSKTVRFSERFAFAISMLFKLGVVNVYYLQHISVHWFAYGYFKRKKLNSIKLNIDVNVAKYLNYILF